MIDVSIVDFDGNFFDETLRNFKKLLPDKPIIGFSNRLVARDNIIALKRPNKNRNLPTNHDKFDAKAAPLGQAFSPTPSNTDRIDRCRGKSNKPNCTFKGKTAFHAGGSSWFGHHGFRPGKARRGK